MRRQAAVLDAGGRVLQETRHFHEDTGSTSPGRSKEEATDYRYFPEPDLVPVAPDTEWVEKLAAELPELPVARRARLQEEWGLSGTEMAWLVNAGALGLVDATVAAGATPADARKWWLGELARRANDAGVELSELAVTPRQVAELTRLVAEGTVNDQLARQALDGVLAGEGDPAQVVEARGLAVMGESDELVAAVEARSEEHTSELQLRQYLVCRLLLEKKQQDQADAPIDHGLVNLLTVVLRAAVDIDRYFRS